MSSPGQRRGLCGHIMAGSDKHKVCARCRDKKKGEDNCVKNLPCLNCDVLTEEQKVKLATPQYQKKKEKREAKAVEESNSTLVDPSTVSVIGLAKDNETVNSEEMSTTPVGAKIKKISRSSEAVSSTPEAVKAKKPDKTPDVKVAKGKSSKKDILHQLNPQQFPLTISLRPWILNGLNVSAGWKPCSSPNPSVSLLLHSSRSVSTDNKLEAMDLKWSERFSRLEAMLLSKSISQPAPAFQSVPWILLSPSLHRPDPPTCFLLFSKLHTGLIRWTHLLLPTNLLPDQWIILQLLHLVLNRLTDPQIRTWTLYLILILNPSL